MTEKKLDRSNIRFEKEAKALQKNLEKRRIQQENIKKMKSKEEQENVQTEN